MSVRIRAGLMALAVVATTSATAAAQEGLEIGMDAALAFDLTDPTALTFDLPVSQVRVGFPAGGRFTIEPALGVNYLKVEDTDAVAFVNADIGALYHFGMDMHRGLYVRPRIGFTLVHVGESQGQFAAGIGVGTKMGITDQLAARAEAFYRHGFENDDFFGTDQIGVSIGASFFTR